VRTNKKRRKFGATSKNLEKNRERKQKKTSEKAKKMKKFLYGMVQRTRGRDTPHEIMMEADKMLVPVVGTARQNATADLMLDMCR
jgi:hypothetical protein